jgi:hypothetical protein
MACPKAGHVRVRPRFVAVQHHFYRGPCMGCGRSRTGVATSIAETVRSALLWVDDPARVRRGDPRSRVERDGIVRLADFALMFSLLLLICSNVQIAAASQAGRAAARAPLSWYAVMLFSEESRRGAGATPSTESGFRYNTASSRP